MISLYEKVLFSDADIFSYHYEHNQCLILNNVIVDNTHRQEPFPIFWHDNKRLVKFIDRIDGDWADSGDLYLHEDSNVAKKKTLDYELKIDEYKESLFLLYDLFYSNIGHFLYECYPKIWYFENLNRNLKIATIELPDQFNSAPFIKKLLYVKYKDLHDELNFGKTYHIKELIIPGYFYFMSDPHIPDRIFNLYDELVNNFNPESELNKNIYISRQDIVNKNENRNLHYHNRILKNENELITGLIEKQYEIIELKHFKSGKDTINLFREANNIVLTNGAAESLLLFCSENTNVNFIVNPRMNDIWPWIIRQVSNRKKWNLRFVYPVCEFFETETYGYHVDEKKRNVPWKILNLKEVLDQI